MTASNGFPVAALLVLESKGSQGTVVGSTSGDACGKKLGVGEEVGGHEGAIGMASNCNALAVANSHIHHLIDGCFRVGYQLLDKEIVGLLLAFPYDGHFGLVHDRIATSHPVDRGTPTEAGKRVFGASHLGGISRRFVFSGIGPHEYR